MAHKPKTRRHLRGYYDAATESHRMLEVIYRQTKPWLGYVAVRYIGNAGKDYSPKTEPVPLDGTATANTRDIRGHGLTTSRVKRWQRGLMDRWRAYTDSLPKPDFLPVSPENYRTYLDVLGKSQGR